MDTVQEEKAGRKTVFAATLRPREVVRSSFLVRRKLLLKAHDGKPYLGLTLGDKSGDLDGRLWQDAESTFSLFNEGDVVAVFGKTHLFGSRLQLVVQSLAPVPPAEVEMTDYVEDRGLDLDVMYEKLLGLFRAVKNPHVGKLALALLTDPEISTRYKVCPAAKTIHHAFRGGLLYHSLKLIDLVDAVAPLYPNLDRDVLLFGAAFHDFGKIYELFYDGPFGYTDEGQLVGHITIGVTLVDRKIQAMPGFPPDLEWQLKHLILSHHGRLEYGSPKKPATLEAEVLCRLDDLDSRIDSIGSLIAADTRESRWTGYHKAYDAYYYKPAKPPKIDEPL